MTCPVHHGRAVADRWLDRTLPLEVWSAAIDLASGLLTVRASRPWLDAVLVSFFFARLAQWLRRGGVDVT